MPRRQCDCGAGISDSSVVCYGAASASGIVVGRTIGEGNQQRLRPLVHTLQVLFVSIGLCSGLLIFLLRVPILALLGGTLTETAYTYSLQFMLVLAITTVGTSYQMACDNGIIRGGGDTKFSAKMNIISMWLIVVPFSAMAAFWWKFPPVVVFFLLKWDQLYKIIPVAIRLHSWKWVKKVTRRIPQKVKIEFILSLWGSLQGGLLFLHRVSGAYELR